MTDGLPQRHDEILDILISDYVATAQPVGSRTIAKRYKKQLSPATIRNVMADLTELGLLSQPHTSAGRVPTPVGMRYYIDTLLKRRELTSNEVEAIRSHCLGDEMEINAILSQASSILANISKYVSLIVAPKADEAMFKQMQFIPLSKNRILGILVSCDGMVYNRFVEVDEEYTYPDLDKISNYCNKIFQGLTLKDARRKIKSELEQEYMEYDRLLKKAIVFSQNMMSEIPVSELMVDGESQLLDVPEFADTKQFKALLLELDEKKRIMHLLERCEDGDEVKVFIGADAGIDGLDFVGVVGAPYYRDGNVVGALGVIGPLRMDYSSVVPIVDFTARILSDVLN